MIVVKYDTQTNYVKSFNPTGDAVANATTLVFHDQNTSVAVLNALFLLGQTVPTKYMIVANAVPREMTQLEKNQVDAAETAALIASAKAAAKAIQDAVDANARVLRAVVKETVDEINLLREWIVSFKAQTALATSLANLQTRVAALPDMPDRTYAQAKTAISSIVDGE